MVEEVLRLRSSGLSYAEISKMLNIPIGTIKSVISRNKEKGATPVNACKYCGKELVNIPHHKPRTFCSNACKAKWWNKNRLEHASKRKVEHICLCCGAVFYDYAWKNRKYCSNLCYKKVRYGK